MNVGAARVCMEGHVRTRSIRTIASVHKDAQDMVVRQASVLQFTSGCHFIEYIHIIILDFLLFVCAFGYKTSTRFSVTFSVRDTHTNVSIRPK